MVFSSRRLTREGKGGGINTCIRVLVGYIGNQNVTPTGIFFLILDNITILTTLSTPERSLPEYADYENHCCQVQFLC